MNILYTITAYPPSTGGAQTHLSMFAGCLSSKHEVQVCSLWDANRTDWLLGTTFRADTARTYTYNGIPIHKMGFTTAQKILMTPAVVGYYPAMGIAAPWIASFLTPQILSFSKNADIIHNIRLGREPLSYASLQTARKQGIPFIFTPLHHPRWRGWRYQVYHRLYQQADALIALTQVEKEYLVSTGISPEKIHVLGTGPVLAENTSPETFLERYAIDGPMVLFLGQHFEYKGYRELLSAAPLVWQHFPETHFVFIGPAVRSSEQVFEGTNDRRIHRLGTVDLQTKTDALAACTLLCVPSTQESFGGVYTEAWSYKKPVIGCPIPAVSEVIADGRDGFLVNQEPEPISERIIYLLNNPQTTHQMGERGYQKVLTQFTWERLSLHLEEIYRSVLR